MGHRWSGFKSSRQSAPVPDDMECYLCCSPALAVDVLAAWQSSWPLLCPTCTVQYTLVGLAARPLQID